MTTLVLAHGILGFGNPLGLPFPVNYFNGVAKHFIDRGFRVESPRVGAFSSIKREANKLASSSRGCDWRRMSGSTSSLTACGLEIRHALATVPGVKEREATLVTIGTPHAGSTVADAVEAGAGPIFDAVPFFIREALTAGLHDLTTARVAAFNQTTAFVSGSRYIAIAGSAALGSHELLLFQLASVVGQQTNQITDGVAVISFDEEREVASVPVDRHPQRVRPGRMLLSPAP